MKKLNRAATWTVTNAAFAWAVYAGYAQHIDGAHHVAVFAIWLMFIASFFAVNDDVRKKLQAKGPQVSPYVGGTFDAAIAIFLVWHGAWFLGAIYVIHALLIHGAYHAELEVAHD